MVSWGQAQQLTDFNIFLKIWATYPRSLWVNVNSFPHISQYNLTQPTGNHSQITIAWKAECFSREIFLSLSSRGPLEKNRTIPNFMMALKNPNFCGFVGVKLFPYIKYWIGSALLMWFHWLQSVSVRVIWLLKWSLPFSRTPISSA